MKLAKAFRSNLQALRQKRNLTQQALADRAGISVAYVSLLERGERTPPLETIETLASALRVRPLDLVSRGRLSA